MENPVGFVRVQRRDPRSAVHDRRRVLPGRRNNPEARRDRDRLTVDHHV